MEEGRSRGTMSDWLRRTLARDPLTGEEAHLERHLGWVRLVGGTAILLSAWQNPTVVPSWIDTMLVSSGVLLLVAGVVTLVVVPRLQSPHRALEALSLADAVLISMLIPFGLAQDSPYLFFVFTVLTVLGGVRLGRLGVLRNLVVAAPFEALRLVVGQSLYGNQNVEDTVIAILVAAGLGVLVADVASSGRQARRATSDALTAAHRDRVLVRRVEWETEVVGDVVRLAGTGPSVPALQRAVEAIRERLVVSGVQVVTLGAAGALVVAAGTGDGAGPGVVVEVLPGGPRDRAMSLGTVAAATHDDLEALAGSGPMRGSVVAAPLPIDGRLLGLLVVESAEGDLLHRRDALLVERLGRALATFVERANDAHGGVAVEPSASTVQPPRG